MCSKGTHYLANIYMRLLHEGDLRRCFRDSGSVTYVSTLPVPQLGLGALRHLALTLRSCISSFVQSLSTFDSNVREWHFVQHSHGMGRDGAGLRIRKDFVRDIHQRVNG